MLVTLGNGETERLIRVRCGGGCMNIVLLAIAAGALSCVSSYFFFRAMKKMREERERA